MYEVFDGNLGKVLYRIFATEVWAEVEVWLERGYEVFVDDDHMMITIVLM